MVVNIGDTVLLTDQTVGEVTEIHADGTVTVLLANENGNPLHKTGNIEEILEKI